MVRIDMSEYQEKHTVSRMIGAPPGYVGYEEAGQLTEAVRRRPYAVVLFDEIEKAHPEVLNVLLQLLDDGRLTDGKGRTVDFKNTVVIMTSNLGSQFIAEQRGERRRRHLDEGTRRQVMDALRAHFRPEFLNRIDEIIFFHALGREHMKQIIDIQLRGLMKRLEERKIHVAAHRCGQGATRSRRLRSDLRRAAAQADHPAAGAGSRSRMRVLEGDFRGRRHGRRRCRTDGAELREARGRSGHRMGRRGSCQANPRPRFKPRSGDRRGQRGIGHASRRSSLWYGLAFLLLLGLAQMYFLAPRGRSMPYSEFKTLLKNGAGRRGHRRRSDDPGHAEAGRQTATRSSRSSSPRPASRIRS